MTATGGMATGGDPRRSRQLAVNLSATLATLIRKPRLTDGRRPAWSSPGTWLIGGLITIAVVAAAMVFLDGRAMNFARGLPPRLIGAFDEFTDFGKSNWLLIPPGVLLIIIAATGIRELPHFTRLVLAALTVRLGFLFVAIGLPGLFVAILKRMIGRARPFAGADGGTLNFIPFIWRADYASFPSGHGTTAFAAVIAIGALWPRARAIMWIYALLIAVSRVIITTHYPSDVIASAVFGVVGAILVRDWFAVRRLGFIVDDHGSVHALPGPSWRRIKTVVRRLFNA
jgi:membrane-associated phospholipid phosphatase